MLAAHSNGAIGGADHQLEEVAQLRLQKQVLKKAFLREQALRTVLEEQLAARDREIMQLLAEVRSLRGLSGKPGTAGWNVAINGYCDESDTEPSAAARDLAAEQVTRAQHYARRKLQPAAA
jgi:hypothetical protein